MHGYAQSNLSATPAGQFARADKLLERRPDPSLAQPVHIVSSGPTARSPEHPAQTAAFPRRATAGPIFGRVRHCPMAAANDRGYASGEARDAGIAADLAAAPPTLVTAGGK